MVAPSHGNYQPGKKWDINDFIKEINSIFNALKVDFWVNDYTLYWRKPVENLSDPAQQIAEINAVEGLKDLSAGDYLFIGQAGTRNINCVIVCLFFCEENGHNIRSFSIEIGRGLAKGLKGPEEQVKRILAETRARLKSHEESLAAKFDAVIRILRLVKLRRQ